MQTAGDEGRCQRDCLLSPVAAHLPRRRAVCHGVTLLQGPVQVRVPRQEVLQQVPQLHTNPEEAGESRRAAGVPLRRQRGL